MGKRARCRESGPSALGLNEDIAFCIARYLVLEDLLSVIQVNKHFNSIFSARGIWLSYAKDLVDRGYSLPTKGFQRFEDLNHVEMKRTLLKACKPDDTYLRVPPEKRTKFQHLLLARSKTPSNGKGKGDRDVLDGRGGGEVEMDLEAENTGDDSSTFPFVRSEAGFTPSATALTVTDEIFLTIDEFDTRYSAWDASPVPSSYHKSTSKCGAAKFLGETKVPPFQTLHSHGIDLRNRCIYLLLGPDYPASSVSVIATLIRVQFSNPEPPNPPSSASTRKDGKATVKKVQPRTPGKESRTDMKAAFETVEKFEKMRGTGFIPRCAAILDAESKSMVVVYANPSADGMVALYVVLNWNLGMVAFTDTGIRVEGLNHNHGFSCVFDPESNTLVLQIENRVDSKNDEQYTFDLGHFHPHVKHMNEISSTYSSTPAITGNNHDSARSNTPSLPVVPPTTFDIITMPFWPPASSFERKVVCPPTPWHLIGSSSEVKPGDSMDHHDRDTVRTPVRSKTSITTGFGPRNANEKHAETPGDEQQCEQPSSPPPSPPSKRKILGSTFWTFRQDYPKKGLQHAFIEIGSDVWLDQETYEGKFAKYAFQFSAMIKLEGPLVPTAVSQRKSGRTKCKPPASSYRLTFRRIHFSSDPPCLTNWSYDDNGDDHEYEIPLPPSLDLSAEVMMTVKLALDAVHRKVYLSTTGGHVHIIDFGM